MTWDGHVTQVSPPVFELCAFVEQLEKKRISLSAEFKALRTISGLVWSRHVKGQLSKNKAEPKRGEREEPHIQKPLLESRVREVAA